MKELIRFLQALLGRNTVYYIGGSDVLPPPLKGAEEQQALRDLETGDENAKQLLIERNLRLVVFLARRFENTGVNLEDLISIGTIGLIKGISTFDPKKGARLATYAARCVENAMHPPGRHFPFRLTKRDRCASSDPIFVLATQHNCSFGLRRIFFTDPSV